MPEWSNGADSRSVSLCLRGFESSFPHCEIYRTMNLDFQSKFSWWACEPPTHKAPVAQFGLECLPPKEKVAGSSPARSVPTWTKTSQANNSLRTKLNFQFFVRCKLRAKSCQGRSINFKKNKMRRQGLEPWSTGWKPVILPLNYPRIYAGLFSSRFRISGCKLSTHKIKNIGGFLKLMKPLSPQQ